MMAMTTNNSMSVKPERDRRASGEEMEDMELSGTGCESVGASEL